MSWRKTHLVLKNVGGLLIKLHTYGGEETGRVAESHRVIHIDIKFSLSIKYHIICLERLKSNRKTLCIFCQNCQVLLVKYGDTFKESLGNFYLEEITYLN